MNVRPATLHDLAQIRKLGDPEKEALGWMPDAAIIHYVQLGHSLVAEDANELVGYLIGTVSMMHAPLLARTYQITTEETRRGRGIAKALLNAFEGNALMRNANAIMATVAEDLPAVRWWWRQEYDPIGHAKGGTRRNRRCIIFLKEFIADATESKYCKPPAHRPGGRYQYQPALILPD